MNETPEPAGIGVLIDSDHPVPSGQGDCANFRVCHRSTRASDRLLIEDEPDNPLAVVLHHGPRPSTARRLGNGPESSAEGERRPFLTSSPSTVLGDSRNGFA